MRVNVSIDSLDARRYAELTRGARLDDALAGLDAALAAGFSPVKVNAVLLAGVEDEVDAFVALTRERDVHVRFIEYMPLDRRLAMTPDGADGGFVPAGFILERLLAEHGAEPVDGPFGLGPARYYRVPGARGTIGFIAGVSDHFCARCNRLRLMADGQLKTCLFSGQEIDVRPLMDTPSGLAAAIAGRDRRQELRPSRRGARRRPAACPRSGGRIVAVERLSHIDETGRARMVDVGDKAETERAARRRGAGRDGAGDAGGDRRRQRRPRATSSPRRGWPASWPPSARTS